MVTRDMYTAHNKGKSVVDERLITTLNKKHDFSFKIYIDS